jgi:hypothetical protein
MAEEIYDVEEGEYQQQGVLTDDEMRELFRKIRDHRKTKKQQVLSETTGRLQAALEIAEGGDVATAKKKYHPTYGLSQEEEAFYIDQITKLLRIAGQLEGKRITSVGKVIEMKADLQKQLFDLYARAIAGEYSLAGSTTTALVGAKAKLLTAQQKVRLDKIDKEIKGNDPQAIDKAVTEYLNSPGYLQAKGRDKEALVGNVQFWGDLLNAYTTKTTPGVRIGLFESFARGSQWFPGGGQEALELMDQVSKGAPGAGAGTAAGQLAARIRDDRETLTKADKEIAAIYEKATEDAHDEFSRSSARPKLARAFTEIQRSIKDLSTDPETQEEMNKLLKSLGDSGADTARTQAEKYISLIDEDTDDPNILASRKEFFANPKFRTWASSVVGKEDKELMEYDLRIALRELNRKERREGGPDRASSQANALEYRRKDKKGLVYNKDDRNLPSPSPSVTAEENPSADLAQTPAQTNQPVEDVDTGDYEGQDSFTEPPSPEDLSTEPPPPLSPPPAAADPNEEPPRRGEWEGAPVTFTIRGTDDHPFMVATNDETGQETWIGVDQPEIDEAIAAFETATVIPPEDAPLEVTPAVEEEVAASVTEPEEYDPYYNYSGDWGEKRKEEDPLLGTPGGEHTLFGEEGLEDPDARGRVEDEDQMKAREKREAKEAKKAARKGGDEQAALITGAPILADVSSEQPSFETGGPVPQDHEGTKTARDEALKAIMAALTGKGEAELIRRRHQGVDAGTRRVT